MSSAPRGVDLVLKIMHKVNMFCQKTVFSMHMFLNYKFARKSFKNIPYICMPVVSFSHITLTLGTVAHGRAATFTSQMLFHIKYSKIVHIVLHFEW